MSDGNIVLFTCAIIACLLILTVEAFDDEL